MRNYRQQALSLFLAAAFIVASFPVSIFASPYQSSETATPQTQAPLNIRAQEQEAQALLAAASPADREKLEKILQEMDEIDRETEIAQESYNAAKERLDRIRSDIDLAKKRYETVSRAYEIQSKELGERIADQYREGMYAGWEMLLGSDSIITAVERLRYLSEVAESDARLLSTVRDDKKSLEETLNQLSRDEKDAQSLEFELKARAIEVQDRNAKRQRLLEEQNQHISALIEATMIAQGAEERLLALQIEMGRLGQITVKPGSPVETALAYRGIKYVWGGESKAGFDCSGLVLYVFAQHGVSLPHYSGSQFQKGTAVTGELLPGDAVFFGTPIHHVGIYIGGGYYIHAPRTGDVVRIAELSRRKDYRGARRYSWTERTAPIR